MIESLTPSLMMNINKQYIIWDTFEKFENKCLNRERK